MNKDYEVIIVGSGPAGYVAAIRCSQLGLKTLCVEKHGEDGKPSLGGTCLNVGCIPSKSLLESSLEFYKAKNTTKEHGIHLEGITLDIKAMQNRKNNVVKGLTSGVQGLFKLNGVDSLQAKAVVEGEGKICLKLPDGSEEEFNSKYIIIATGSKPKILENIKFDRETIVSSTQSLSFDRVPPSLAIIGAGYIGLELGSIWSRLGSKVTILEALEDFLPDVDKQVSDEAFKILTKQGLDIQLGSKVISAKKEEAGAQIKYENESQELSLASDKLIVATGRDPVTEEVIGPESGIELDEKGFIKVNAKCETNIHNVFAIGDTVRGPLLAHKASEEGIMVAENIAGETIQVNYELIPSVIYTHPEIAWVGLTEGQALDKGLASNIGVFPFRANGRAMASGDNEGFVKFMSNQQDNSILGAHVIGPNASEIIQQVVIAMRTKTTVKELTSTVFSHPSYSESLHEAALLSEGKAIHISNRKR